LRRGNAGETDLEQSYFDLALTLPGLGFRFTEQFLAALAPMAATVIVHAQGMGLVNRVFRRFARPRGARSQGPSVILVTAIVAIMLATHFVELIVWAAFFLLAGLLSNPELAMQVSMNSYSTLGGSAFALEERWRGLAGFEAMTAMLMFGWSTAVLAAVVLRASDIGG